mgnify:CR=1 FL=1
MEFWPYLSGDHPTRIKLNVSNKFVRLGSHSTPEELRKINFSFVTEEIRDDADSTWELGLSKNPRIKQMR